MRLLEKNKKTIYYCLYLGQETLLDSNGFETGEKAIKYSAPVEYKAHVSANKGLAKIDDQGVVTYYDNVILLDEPITGLNENTVFFVNKSPAFSAIGIPLYDYRVEKIAETVNQIAVAIQKVGS